MPFKSARQRKYLFANKPAVAKEFAAAERREKHGKRKKTKS